MIFFSISVFPFLALAVANNEDARTQLVKGNEQFTANMFNVSKVLDPEVDIPAHLNKLYLNKYCSSYTNINTYINEQMNESLQKTVSLQMAQINSSATRIIS